MRSREPAQNARSRTRVPQSGPVDPRAVLVPHNGMPNRPGQPRRGQRADDHRGKGITSFAARTGPRTAGVDRRSVRRPAALHRDLAAGRAALVGAQHEQGNRGRRTGGPRRDLSRGRMEGTWNCGAGARAHGVRHLHYSAWVAVRNQWRHLRLGVAQRHAAGKHGHSRAGGRDRQRDWHHGRFGAADSPPSACQPSRA